MPTIRSLYIKALRPYVSPLAAQRLKLIYFVWGYWRLWKTPGLVLRFLRVDWNVCHAHYPSEISEVVNAILARRGNVVEAGCFRGGSSAKFSIAAKRVGARLLVYDSFEGVEPMTEEEKKGTYDFSGQYACSMEDVKANVERYGEISVCSFHRGWFRDTLARGVPVPVSVAYIDCDVARGTRDALRGIVPALTPEGVVFTQDYHIKPVRDALHAEPLDIEHLCDNLAAMRPVR
jgi:O-methyltransferase